MFGCLFTGTLLLSCIDRNPSDSSDFLERVVQCVGPVEKDIEVDTEGSFLSRLAGLAGTLGPSGGGSQAARPSWAELETERLFGNVQSLLVHSASFPRRSFKTHGIISKPHFPHYVLKHGENKLKLPAVFPGTLGRSLKVF